MFDKFIIFTFWFLFSGISCLFVSNLNESSAAPSLQPGNKSIKPVMESDLVMNVFRDGRWGTFRHQLITQGRKVLLILRPVTNTVLLVSLQPFIMPQH